PPEGLALRKRCVRIKVCVTPPEGPHTAVIEAVRRFTGHAPSVEARTALDAGIRFWRRWRRRNGQVHRFDEIASVGGFGGVGRRKAADGEILRYEFGR